MRIGLDYGHGVKNDGGSVGFIKEEDVIDAVGNEFKFMLENSGHTVILLRPSSAQSTDDSLYKRCKMANDNYVDLVVSIHANMQRGKRHEVYIIGRGGQAEQYANRTYEALNEITKSERGVKVANLAVLRGTNAPAILVELFFLDTKEDVDLYNSVGAKRYAAAIFKGITGKEFINNTKYYVVTDYLKKDANGYINTEPILPLFQGIRFYLKRNEKGIWIETQYLDYNKCLELKNKLGSLFWSIKED